jgi:hypothetical protein
MGIIMITRWITRNRTITATRTTSMGMAATVH